VIRGLFGLALFVRASGHDVLDISIGLDALRCDRCFYVVWRHSEIGIRTRHVRFGTLFALFVFMLTA